MLIKSITAAQFFWVHRHRTNVRIFSEKVLREQEFNRGPLGPEPTLLTLSLAFKSNHPRGFKLSVFYRYRIVHRTSLINVMTHLTSSTGSMIILNYAENYSLWLDSFFSPTIRVEVERAYLLRARGLNILWLCPVSLAELAFKAHSEKPCPTAGFFSLSVSNTALKTL